ncbi:MAG: lamin tail domain-containing protein [Planctomycetota bacterium]
MRLRLISILVILVVSLVAGAVRAEWTAYNDCLRETGDSTAANVTGWTIHNYDLTHYTGRLKDFETGSDSGMPTVTFTMGSAGLNVSGGGAGGNPVPGTDAYEIFSGIVDFGPNAVYYGGAGWWVEIEFTGLSPANMYSFVGTAIRSRNYPNRISLFKIIGASSFIWNSSPGVGGSGDTVELLAGDNSITGYVVRWDEIVPSASGSFKIRAEAAPESDGGRAYPFGGYMLQELGAPGNQPPQVGAGSDRQIMLPINNVKLDGAVEDDGLGDPNGFLEITWSKDSGPGVVTFEPNEFVENPTARFYSSGEYVLKLSAWDGELDANDVVTITVLEPNCPLGDLTDDCKVGYDDVQIMIEQWLTDPVHSGFGYPDLDYSNLVDMGDFTLLSGYWHENWQAGSLHVSIYPGEARNDGAQWRVDGGAVWYNHDDVVDDLSIDTHTVEFRTIADWDKPADLEVNAVYGQVAEANGTYIEHTGSLQVNISPQEADDVGAKWRRVGESIWRGSGVSGREDDVLVGPHNVEFSTVSGWLKPGVKEVFVEHNLLEELNVTYIPQGDITLQINEFMATNSTGSGITDEHGDSDDWIEIYNSTDSPVDIGGMHIADEQDKWEIPGDNSVATTIAANGYLLLWADNEQTEGPLHLPFQLDAGRDEITLYDADGITVIDNIAFDNQVTNVSYGRYPDGSDTWYFYKSPTDGSSNNQAGFADVVADTKFSPDRGFYDSTFYVTITTDTLGATIYYTTDCTWPIDQFGNPTATAQTYDEATNRPYITTTTNLRAAAVKAGCIPTNVDTQTYIFLNYVLQQPTNPSGYPNQWIAGSRVVTGDYQVDPDIVGHSQSANRLTMDDMRAVPTIVASMPIDDWFSSSSGIYVRGVPDGTEYPCSFEYFDPNGSGLNLQQNCAMSMQGGISGGGTSLNRWKTPKLSNRPRFKTQTDNGTPTGGPAKLRAKIFPDSPIEDFDTIVLDAVLNHSWHHSSSGQRNSVKYIQDQGVADLHNAMLPGHSPHGSYAHVYINNLYWGMYYIHERPDNSWAAETFGGQKEQYDAIKHSRSNVINNGVGGSGATANFNTMESAANAAGRDPTNLAKWQTVEQHLDVDNLITYLLAHWFAGVHDWPGKNWYATHRVGGQWRFHTWDAEHSFEGQNNVDQSPEGIHSDLRNHIEYKMRWADHIHKHFHHGGPLSYPRCKEIYQARVTQVNEAICGESARWGDYRRNPPHTRSEWLSVNTQSGSYFTNRSANVFSWLSGLYPNTNPPDFEVNGSSMYGGYVSYGDNLTITKDGSGTIWYTTNGDDPRSPGGEVNSASALQYTGTPISLTHSVRVKARVLNGGEWSALSDAIYAFEQPIVDNLRITEIMYNPQDMNNPNDPNTEFIELKNIGTETLNLNLVNFANGIDFTFPNMEVAPDEYILVVRDLNAFTVKYPSVLDVAGQYSGSLNNGGERIELQDAAGQTILNFKYSDGWYDITDGMGFSLTIKDPTVTDPNEWDSKSSWRPSANVGGSPGLDDTGQIPEIGDVVINELLAHSHAEAPDWIELHNTTGSTINIGGWFLSDDGDDLTKYEIAEGTIIEPNDYVVFYEDVHFGNPAAPGSHMAFGLSENGETLYLHSGSGGQLTGYSENEKFGASATGVSFGRYLKSTGSYNFVAMSENTPGQPNAYPKVGPVVVTEIMYHPEMLGDSEYVELLNISDSPVVLYNSTTGEPWRFTDDPDNPGIEFFFPSGPVITLDSGEYLLLVENLSALNAKYNIPGGIQVFEWDNGKLDNGGEKLQLSMPGDVDEQGLRQWIRVDRIRYSDGSHPDDFSGVDPWPIEADGAGLSLSRIYPAFYGNDPNNWQAAAPSPGGEQ